jgi:hypothetical protein
MKMMNKKQLVEIEKVVAGKSNDLFFIQPICCNWLQHMPKGPTKRSLCGFNPDKKWVSPNFWLLLRRNFATAKFGLNIFTLERQQ